ncbi:hypothetical protein ACWKH1_000778 [Listeria monocytogenes]|nr:hypothetical protein [Listeria monocytogenes]EAE1679063.1 hypothetical protein [Listeria monocytogenes LIS0071]EAF4592528.1 hypothetical protein [Listeria monocytogenes serotype 1/2a]EAA0149066.1 hypothetical protein [Listeria monocytogenes]EAA0308923.1 hypothetical protein [Listeria monocytogenes]
MREIAFTNSFLTKRNRKESVLTIELSITGEDFSDLSILPELYSEINSLANRLSKIKNNYQPGFNASKNLILQAISELQNFNVEGYTEKIEINLLGIYRDIHQCIQINVP